MQSVVQDDTLHKAEINYNKDSKSPSKAVQHLESVHKDLHRQYLTGRHGSISGKFQAVGSPNFIEKLCTEAIAAQEIKEFRELIGFDEDGDLLPILAMYDADGAHNNPLSWWKSHAVNFPNLAQLARRTLCIPATSAPSERLFSVAGLTVTKKRARLSDHIVTLLVFLRNAWAPVEAWRKKRAASVLAIAPASASAKK